MATILYADDMFWDSIKLERHVEMIAKIGHLLIIVKNGGEALEVLEQRKIDLLYLDYDMPKMSGKGVLRELKKRGLEVPVVMCSRSSRKVLEEAVASSGYSHVIGYCGNMRSYEVAEFLKELGLV
jgi:CheY-like chemotaxis protein